MQRAIRPVCGGLSFRPVGPVRFTPERALPIARLSQQMLPCDLLIVFGREEIDARGHVIARTVADIADQSALPGESDDRGQERLRDAIGDVDALRLAPLGHDVALICDEAARRAPRLERAEALSRELGYFVDCVLKDENPINDGKAGLRVVKMLEASTESIRKKGALVYL